jgi:hypothetical protein
MKQGSKDNPEGIGMSVHGVIPADDDFYVVSEDGGTYLHLMVAASMGLLTEDDVYDRPERVEHINGDRLDNRRENLRLRIQKNEIESFMHCAQCLKELEHGLVPDETPRSYARIELGVTPTGFQVWCVRHEAQIGYFGIPPQCFGAPRRKLAVISSPASWRWLN